MSPAPARKTESNVTRGLSFLKEFTAPPPTLKTSARSQTRSGRILPHSDSILLNHPKQKPL